jgi:hypothetical protein
MSRSSILLLLLLSTTTSALANDWHRVLIPVYFEGEVAGAFGSRWVVELKGFNGFGTHQRLTSDPGRVCGPGPSQCGDFIPPGEFFNAAAYVAKNGANVGRFVYVRSSFEGIDQPQTLRLSLVTRDVSREAEGFGTQIPVVRESDTFRGSIPFPSVPAGPRFRQKLRVYDFDGQLGHSVVVSVYKDGLIAQRTLTMASSDEGAYPTDPGFAQLDLDAMPELAGQDAVNVIVRPAQEGRYWAFISVTNNETQQVTTLAP